jgi:hypothetical protein
VQGTQIGLINVADSTTGVSFGLINIVKKGYHKASFYSTDLLPTNFAWKSGSAKLYSILLAGINFDDEARSYTIGYGIGREMLMHKHYSITTEFTAETFHMGSEDENSQLYRLAGSFQYKPIKGLTVFGGPVLSMHFRDQADHPDTYKGTRPGHGYPGVNLGAGRAWLGWQIGITIF